MIDVKTARDIEELKRQIFINFREIQRKLDTVGESVVNYDSGLIIAPSSSGGNVFDTVYLKDANTWITRNGSGDLVFRDANAGEVTLSEIKSIADLFWEYGNAKGVLFTNAANVEKRVGLMAGADGVTIFNNVGEIE